MTSELAADLFARAVQYLHGLPPPVVVAGALLLLVVVLTMVSGDPIRCSSVHSGRRCVHDEGHGSSHRDELGNYWN